MYHYYQKIKLTISIIIIAFSLFTLLAFNSYWTTSIHDQSELINHSKNYLNTTNALGGIGAQISEFFIRSFGIAAYLLTSITLLTGFKLMFNFKRLSYLVILIQHIFLIIWIPLFFGQISLIQLNDELLPVFVK